MRVLKQILEEVGGKLCLEGRAFTGHAYVTTDDGYTVCRVERILAGEIIGEERRWGELPLQVSDDGRLRPEPDGEPFRGILLDFDEFGRLCFEGTEPYARHDGENFAWHPGGTLAEYSRKTASGERGESWAGSGELISVRRDGLFATFPRGGRLFALSLDAGYDPLELFRIPLFAGEELSLSGPGVDNSVLASIAGLETVTTLHLDETNLSITSLSAFPNLRYLQLKRNRELSALKVQGSSFISSDCLVIEYDDPTE